MDSIQKESIPTKMSTQYIKNIDFTHNTNNSGLGSRKSSFHQLEDTQALFRKQEDAGLKPYL